MLRAFAGGTLFGERYGEGEPRVLALHGWARTHADFAAVLGGEAPLDAVALDLPGFGATLAPPTRWGSPEYADALVPVLEETAARVVLCGHSFGGRVAVELAARRPERIAGLVLCGVPLYRPPGARARPPIGYRLVRSLARAGLLGERRLDAARERYGSADYRAASGVMREVLVGVLQERYDAALASIDAPVELVWGERDEDVPVEVAHRIADTLAHARLTVLDDVGHLVPSVAPEALRAAIDRLL